MLAADLAELFFAPGEFAGEWTPVLAGGALGVPFGAIMGEPDEAMGDGDILLAGASVIAYAQGSAQLAPGQELQGPDGRRWRVITEPRRVNDGRELRAAVVEVQP